MASMATIAIDMEVMGKAAKAASRTLSTLTTEQKNAALLAIAGELETQAAAVMAENARDIADGRAKGLSDALLDRLLLDEKRMAARRGYAQRRLAARSRRRRDRRPLAAQRHAPQPPPHPHRRDRRDL